MIAAARPAVRPQLSGRPLGFDPRWLVRHALPCDRPALVLPAPRYIGGAALTAKTEVCSKLSRPPSLCNSTTAPRLADAGRLGFTPREYRALRRRLDRWELAHLRQHAAELAEQLNAERRAREQADDAADFWRQQALSVELREGERLCLAVDGSLHVVAAGAEGGAA